jgi:hypothetical protein
VYIIKSNDSLPIIAGKIAKDLKLDILLDSGAGCNCISSEFYLRNKSALQQLTVLKKTYPSW